MTAFEFTVISTKVLTTKKALSHETTPMNVGSVRKKSRRKMRRNYTVLLSPLSSVSPLLAS